jgi:hypothetical protein
MYVCTYIRVLHTYVCRLSECVIRYENSKTDELLVFPHHCSTTPKTRVKWVYESKYSVILTSPNYYYYYYY